MLGTTRCMIKAILTNLVAKLDVLLKKKYQVNAQRSSKVNPTSCVVICFVWHWIELDWQQQNQWSHFTRLYRNFEVLFRMRSMQQFFKRSSIVMLLCLCVSVCLMCETSVSTPEYYKKKQIKHKRKSLSDGLWSQMFWLPKFFLL